MKLLLQLSALAIGFLSPLACYSQQTSTAPAEPVAPSATAATTATTSDGRNVLLYPDGTWRLVVPPNPAGPSSPSVYQKPADAQTYVLAKKGPFGVWINPSKWSVDAPDADADPIKITLSNKRGDAYAMIISERISVPMDTLKNLALQNAKSAAPDTHVTFEEKRMVNGKEVLCMKMEGTMQNIAFTYFGYYYGGPEGTLQVVAYTGSNLFDEYKADFDDFVNGTQIGK